MMTTGTVEPTDCRLRGKRKIPPRLVLFLCLGGLGLLVLLVVVAAMGIFAGLNGLSGEELVPVQADFQCAGKRRWEPGCREPSDGSIRVAPGLESISLILSPYGPEDAREILQNVITFYVRFLESMQFLLGPDHPSLAKGYHFLAGLYFTRGDVEEAERWYQHAVLVAEEGDLDPVDAAAILNNVGLFHLWTEGYTEAEQYFRSSISKVPEGDFHAALAMQNLAGLYGLVGDTGRAETWFGRAVEHLQTDPGAERRYGGKIRLNQILIWQTLGELDRAEKAYGELLENGTYRLNAASRAAILNNLAEIHRLWGDQERAMTLYRGALTEMDSAPMRAAVVENLGVLALEARRDGEAEAYLEEALAIRRRLAGDSSWDVGISLLNLASLEQARAEPAAALDLLARARPMLQGMPADHPASQSLLQLAAAAELDLGNREAALATARDAQALFENRLSRILTFGSESQRLTFQAQSSLYDMLSNVGDELALAEAVLRTKGAVLDSLIEDRAVARTLRAAGDDETASRLRSLRWKLMQAETAVSEDAGKQKEIEGLERELKEVRLGAVEKAGLRRSLRSGLQVEVGAVQRALRPGDVLVEFIQYEKLRDVRRLELSYGAIIVAAQGTPLWIPLGPAGPIDELIGRYQRWMRECSSLWRTRDVEVSTRGVEVTDQVCVGAEKGLASMLEDLHRKTWLPIERTLPSAHGRLIVSPDGRLNLVPFGTLLAEDGRFVLEERPIVYVASGRDLLETSAGAPSFDTTLTVYAIPLDARASGPPSAILREAEVLAEIAGKHGWTVETLVDEMATEERFRAGPQSRIVHLATHGTFLEEGEKVLPWTLQDPMHRGFVVFSEYRDTLDALQHESVRPSPETDGIVLAEEVGMLDLEGTWLTVLSACDTGFGEVRRGEGVLGLRRGFQMAGSRNLLLTLWPIYDDLRTVAFMEDFYDELLSTRDAVAAWNKVKKRHLRQLRERDSLGAALKVAGGFVLTARGPLAPPDRAASNSRTEGETLANL